jgi:NhaP-type Na+/H+ or K+/H+ antiporter
MGILISYGIYKTAESNSSEKMVLDDLRFSEGLFFNLILPLIVFPSGYNMRRKKFFKNIGTIMKFGFLGTIICFSLYTAMLYGAL